MMGATVVESWLWVAFTAGVVFLLLLDLFAFHKKGESDGIGKAIMLSLFWIALALAFNGWFAFQYGGELGLQFLTGYLVEKSLSIDNLFVILLVFRSFSIPAKFQHRTLFWGIFGAVVMRGILIVVGTGLVQQFHWILYIFGLILIVSGLKFLFGSEASQEMREHWAIRGVRRVFPVVDSLSDGRFFVREGGVLKATPIFLALVVIEATDLVFAVDSIPAVLAITQDSFVAFSSNILAILGLRALYFVIADFVSRFRYLKPGLATILCFVGVKMLIAEWYKIPSWVSLLVITMILVTAGLSSWYVNKQERSALDKTED